MAKGFVLQLASLATLFASLPALILLIFSIINLAFPDVGESYWQVQGAESSIRYTIATLVIFFPAYIFLTRKVNKGRRSEGELYHKLTKWFIYLALLVAGLVMLGDLATVVFYFLNGEVTVRFILKAVTMLVIIGAAFYYYLMDAKSYWNEKERMAQAMAGIVSVVVLAFIVVGYLRIDSPSVTREINIDRQELVDLRNMHRQVQSYYQQNEILPESIEQAYPDFPAPVAPKNREAYTYKVTGADSYQLCANFAKPTPETDRDSNQYYSIDKYTKNDIWDHGEGEKCFDRVVFVADNTNIAQ